jgi:LysR family transcriptional activator of nhaA
MERLNYHHLRYFYAVAHEGSVAQASRKLGLKQPTISAQIHALEAKLGRKLLERSGRGLRVTPAGETVLRYAESIFALGGELLSALDGRADDVPRLTVGVSTSLPTSLIARLFKPVFALVPQPILTLVEGTPETFPSQLASRSMQFALTDEPMGNRATGNLHSRVLLESTVGAFAPEVLARRMRKDFPARMSGAPVLMPSGGALCREVESWLKPRKLEVELIASVPHPGTLAESAGAVIFAPSLLRNSLKKLHALQPVGELKGSHWRIYLTTAEKAAKSPALDAVVRAARDLR